MQALFPWLSYAAIVVLVAISAALFLWSYRVHSGDHPLDKPGKKSWFTMCTMIVALLAIDGWKAAIPIVLLLALVAAHIHEWLGVGLLALVGLAAIAHLYTDHADYRRSQERRRTPVVY